MSYVYTAIISLLVGFSAGAFFSTKIHAALVNLEATVEIRLKAIETAIKAKL